ncbi:MAG: MFS transporter [Myxococcota bacterium]
MNTAPSQSSDRRILRLTALGLGLFFVAGATQALYGPLFPLFRSDFGLPESDAGVLVALHSAGGLLGIALWTLGVPRIGMRRALAVGIAIFVVGSWLLGVGTTWLAARAGAACTGLGFGGIVLGTNQLFASGFGKRGAAVLNLINAAFGVAAVTSPLAAVLLPETARRLVFAAFGVLALLLIPLLGSISPDRRGPIERTGSATAATPGGGRSVITTILFMALFLLYVAVESSVAAWETTYLIARGYSAEAGAAWTAAFWGAIAVGRIGAAPLSMRVRPRTMVLSCLLVTVAALAVVPISGRAIPGVFIAVGLALAAVFPTSFVWLTRALPNSRVASGLALAAGMLGGMSGSSLVGEVVARWGIDAAPWALTALAALGLGCAALLYMRAHDAVAEG